MFVELSSSNFSLMIELKSIILSMSECCFLFLSDFFSWWPYSLVDEAPIELLNSEIVISYFTSLRAHYCSGLFIFLFFSVNQLDLVQFLS